MEFHEFKASVQNNAAPKGLSKLLTALWYAAKGNWHDAHEIAQDHEGEQEYDLLHAYLHRVEGDEWNANYWYRRSGNRMPKISLEEEWNELAQRWL